MPWIRLYRRENAAGHDAVEEFGALFEELIAKDKQPTGAEMGEVLASLIFGEVEGERLLPIELVQNCIFLLNGQETTANLVAGSAYFLIFQIRWTA